MLLFVAINLLYVGETEIHLADFEIRAGNNQERFNLSLVLKRLHV
jgi:hypothetical protein